MKYNLKLPSFKSLIFFYTYLRHLCLLSRVGWIYDTITLSRVTIHRLEIIWILHISIRKWHPFTSNNLWADCFGLTNFNIIESYCLLFLLKLKTNRLIALPEATKFNGLGQSSPNFSYRRQQSKSLNLCEHTWMCHSCDILLWDNDFTL